MLVLLKFFNINLEQLASHSHVMQLSWTTLTEPLIMAQQMVTVGDLEETKGLYYGQE